MISLEYLQGKDIAIWGTGLHAVKCAYFLQQRHIFVHCFINSDCKIPMFLGRPVYTPSIEKCKEKMIIVASSERVYVGISEQLVSFGLLEVADFVYYQWFMKQIVLLHGNCHIIPIQEYLNSSTVFCEKYTFYQHPLIQNGMKPLSPQMMKIIDVWIHEDIRTDNQYGYELSDEYMRKDLSKTALEIVIPHLFGLGRAFFPQEKAYENDCIITKGNNAIVNGDDRNGMFPFVDRVIERALTKTNNVNDIICFCKSRDCLSKKVINENFQEYIAKMQKREEQWDIKITEFILSNYKYKKLFYDSGHPTNEVLKKISEDILTKLGIQDLQIECNMVLDAHEVPIYPITREVLNLQWEENCIRTSENARRASAKMDFDEYIREYVWWRNQESVTD